MRTIDITPKWEPLIDPMIAALQNAIPGSDTWKLVREELLRLAQCADQVNANRDAEIKDYEAAQTLLAEAAQARSQKYKRAQADEEDES